MANLPTGTVTFLFTDIEGSTRLAQSHPDQWESLRARHHSILRSAIESHNGYVFHVIGDAFCTAFHTAGDALQAALKSQVTLQAESWGDTPVKVRMGIHTGKAEIQESGDYTGYSALSRVQRLMSAGHGGQTLLSQATRDLVRDELPQGVSLHDLGEHRLKDLIHPEHIHQVNIGYLPCDFPPLKTLNVQLHNLPAQLTPFVGREREIAALLGLLRNLDVRLVTLTGAGGTGKTRLSLQVAAELLDEYKHGTWFVELASISDPELVLPTIAATLKVKESAGTPIEVILQEHLSKRQLLLVLDNFEQVVEAAPKVGKLLKAAPGVKVLVSSREVLRVIGEHNYPVPPLGLPESTSTYGTGADRRKQTAVVLAQYEAVALFIQHARAALPSFELNEENATSVAEICMKLDGLPLAIELAAARSRLLSPAAMLEKLKDRLTLLTGGARGLPQRQQTMRLAIDWSYDLLDEAEKELFASVSVFSGGWTLEAAEAVCAGKSMDVLSGLESLLDKSLVRQRELGNGEMRFGMLETIRAYAFEKLVQKGGLLAIQQAHAGYMEAFLEKVISARNGPDEVGWFAQLDLELDNLRVVVDWALRNDQPRVIFKAGRLHGYWNQRGKNREPLGWLERSINMDADSTPAERTGAMIDAGILLTNIDEDQRARKYYESALEFYRLAGDQKGIARCLGNLGNIAWHERDFEKARQLYEQSSQVELEPGSWNHSMILNNLGSLARILGDWDLSKKYYLQSRQICVKLGADAGVSYADWFLGNLALVQRKLEEARLHYESSMQGGWVQANPLILKVYRGYLGLILLLSDNHQESRRMLDEALESAAELQDQGANVSDFWVILDGKARLQILDGRAESAAQLLGAAWNQRERDYPITEAEHPDYEAVVAAARSALGEAGFEAAFAIGREMTMEKAIAYAEEMGTGK